jgi:uncharacterized protein (TIGR00369 family)
MSSYEFVDSMMEKNQSGELRSAVSQHLGMSLVEFGRGEAVYEMPVREELSNPLGVIQGGVATALADAAMAAATTTILDDEEIQMQAITTVDIFARFIRPVNLKSAETLRAEARVIRAGGGGLSGRRRTCSPTARWWPSSTRRASACLSTRRAISRNVEGRMTEPEVGLETMARFLGAENVKAADQHPLEVTTEQ